jgi:hypothetical protein
MNGVQLVMIFLIGEQTSKEAVGGFQGRLTLMMKKMMIRR